MKKVILAGILLAAVLVSSSAQEWVEYDIFGWGMYGQNGSTMRERAAGDLGVTFYGTASKEGPRGEPGGASYVIEPLNPDSLGLNGRRRIKLVVSGIGDTDVFDMGKLFKLELNNTPMRTQNNTGMNRNDPDFLNARNGEYVFDLAGLGTIRKINIVFYNCTVRALTLRMFVQ